MTFHIGSQTAGTVNNVAGDQTVHGGQHGSVMTDLQALEAVVRLRAALTSLPLEGATAAEAVAAVDEVDRELRAPEPDRSRVAGQLERLTRTVSAAGGLAGAGAALAAPLHALAAWLGPLGAHLVQVLPRL